MSPSDDELVVERSLDRASRIDELIINARRLERTGSVAPHSHTELAEQISPQAKAAVQAYVSGGVYPLERLGRVGASFTDLQLALAMVEMQAGFYNTLVFDRGWDGLSPLRPDLALYKATLDFGLIVLERTVWERVMNLAYCIECGEIPSTGKSKKAHFFQKFLLAHTKWRFLEPYEQLVAKLDDAYRTREVHAGSVLRKVLLGEREVEFAELVKLSNAALNTCWRNALLIVKGEPVAHFSEVHAGSGQMIDPKFLPEAP